MAINLELILRHLGELHILVHLLLFFKEIATFALVPRHIVEEHVALREHLRLEAALRKELTIC